MTLSHFNARCADGLGIGRFQDDPLLGQPIEVGGHHVGVVPAHIIPACNVVTLVTVVIMLCLSLSLSLSLSVTHTRARARARAVDN